jgi:hypothetical protein
MIIRTALAILLLFTLPSARGATVGVQVTWINNYNPTKHLDLSSIQETDATDMNIKLYDAQALSFKQKGRRTNTNPRDNGQVGIKKYTQGLGTIIEITYL